jgi:hypothetical protein
MRVPCLFHGSGGKNQRLDVRPQGLRADYREVGDDSRGRVAYFAIIKAPTLPVYFSRVLHGDSGVARMCNREHIEGVLLTDKSRDQNGTIFGLVRLS